MENKQIMVFVARFREIYNGSPWYGDPIATLLDSIDDSCAFTLPAGKGHSLAQLVAHMTYWRQGLIEKLRGNNEYTQSVDSDDNWVSHERLKKTGWKNIVGNFEKSQADITNLLSKQNDDLLDQEYSRGRTYRYVIQGAIDHDLYHLGQIGIVKNLVI